MRTLVGVLLASLLVLHVGVDQRARAQSHEPAVWTNLSAVLPAKGHARLALFHESSVGITDRMALSTHFLGLVAPHAALSYRLLASPRVFFAMRLGAGYATPFLALITREGALGLLPGDTHPPQAFLLDLSARLSFALNASNVLTLSPGFVTAPRSHNEQPILDFPFLYPRFAALSTGAVPRISIALEGAPTRHLRYQTQLAYTFIGTTRPGFALEQQTSLGVALGRTVLEGGYLASTARYPVGLRSHIVPIIDVRVSF